MTNVRIAAAFSEIADILEFQGANQFRVRAYRNAARTIEDLPEQLATIAADPGRKLTEIDGIGEDLAKKIDTLLTTGKLPMLEELRAEVPESVLAIMRVPGLGPKKAAVLHAELKIASLDMLREACVAQKVRALKGFGAKTEETILAGLSSAATAPKRLLWAQADELVRAIKEYLQGVAGIQQLEAAGSYRRGKETVGDLDFLVVAADGAAVMDHLSHYERVEKTLARGDTKMSVLLENNVQVDLRVVPEESFGAALQYFTGSKDHNVVVRGMAKDLGLKINEYGVFKGEKYVAGRTEEDVYAAVGLPWFPPELREARQEFAWAEKKKLPKLVELDDLIGDLHMHTNATDGRDTLATMIDAAQERGLKYIAITDHSQRVSMAHGLDGPKVLKQWKEIDAVNKKLKNFKVLKGIEVDILEKGGLDLPDNVLAEADWVVASVHYGQKQSRDEITKRIVDALKNPSVSAIAHPTGRLLNRRERYEVDLEAVMQTAREEGKILELNANPSRLDLDDVHCAAAKARGIPIVISTDAHATTELDQMKYGVLQARRAGLTKADVANTRSWADLKKLLKRSR